MLFKLIDDYMNAFVIKHVVKLADLIIILIVFLLQKTVINKPNVYGIQIYLVTRQSLMILHHMLC